MELVRKLFLNGFAVLCRQGTILQLVLAQVVIIIHLMLIIRVQPMLVGSNNAFYEFTTFLLLITFFASALLQIESEFVPSGITRAGYSASLVLALLFGATIAVLVLGVIFLAKDARRSRKSPLMANDKGVPIQLRKLAADTFHLFLSHTWSTGQNQMQALKKEVSLLVPTIEVFLDVEVSGC